jgi:hypothetical protein
MTSVSPKKKKISTINLKICGDAQVEEGQVCSLLYTLKNIAQGYKENAV